MARTAREGGQDSDGALCSGASSVTFARPVRARQDFTHLADWHVEDTPRGRPIGGSDQVGEALPLWLTVGGIHVVDHHCR